MSDLLVIGYDSPARAELAREELFTLSRDYLTSVSDVVVATVDVKGRIKLDQMVTPWTVGATGGSFWGLLVGLLFLHPLLGIATGAAAGAVAGALSDYGIRDTFMKDVSSALQPGQAALFILADRAGSDRVIDKLKQHGGRVMRTNLSSQDEARLREAFDEVRETVQREATERAA